jgi:hypothetical protein
LGVERLVRYERYVAGLPEGLASHPAALAKGALVRNLLEEEPTIAELVPSLPEPLRGLVRDPPVGSEWIPEAHFGALLLALADVRGFTDRQLLAWTRERNRRLFSSAAYRMLMAVVSPAQLLRFAGGRWANWHRGSTLEIDGISDDGVRFSIRYPRGLFDRQLLAVYGEAITAALELANARTPVVELVADEPGRARFHASWG